MQLRQSKKLIFIELVLLLLCLSLLVTASFAWFSISSVPEIVGIDTNVGANGSLEIALLDSKTYLDPSLIQSKIGDSAVLQKPTTSNLAWGNLIDLSDTSYGLSKISLYPTRLNITTDADGNNAVLNNILVAPTYGDDGRTSGLRSDTVSAVYKDNAFTFQAAQQNYGVRAIGTVSGMSVQQTALATARSSVLAYTTASVEAVKTNWKINGAALLNIYSEHYLYGRNTFSNKDIAAIANAAERMYDALGYVDIAMRQGIVGYAASEISDTDTFHTLRSVVENTGYPLSAILSQIPVKIPGNFKNWATEIEQERLAMAQIVAACNRLNDDSHSWNVVYPMIRQLVDPDNAYLDEYQLSNGVAFDRLSADMSLELIPGSGAMGDITDYTGDYNVFFRFTEGVDIEVSTYSSVKDPYLGQIYGILASCKAATNNTGQESAKLNDLYGYAIDLAFRCNAQSDLLLQTEDALRQNSSQTSGMQGSGSYMKLSCKDMDTEQIVYMMDAIRIAFIDQQNKILAIAKLNTSNHTPLQNGATAPLYLYEYSVGADGGIRTGERLLENNAITALTKNTVSVITAVVWLDGDYVSNSMASYKERHMTGVLNLQFASSADLQASNQLIDGNS